MPLYQVIDPVSDAVSEQVAFQLQEAEKKVIELNQLRQQLTQLFVALFVVVGAASCSSGSGPGAASASRWRPWGRSCAACRRISI